YEIDAFTPIVNQPEAAILGLGRIVARPVVVDEASERIAVRRMIALSLTFDHRVVDGAPAARFLQRVKHLVEHPYRWALGSGASRWRSRRAASRPRPGGRRCWRSTGSC